MRALSRFYGGLYAVIGLLCGILVGGIAFGITLDVLMRNLSGAALAWTKPASAAAAAALGPAADVLLRYIAGSLPWVMEVNEYALYVITALGAPWALRRGAHVRVDLLVQGMRAAIARWFDAAADLIGLLASGVLVYYAWSVGYAAYLGNNRLIKVLIIPEWWVYAVLVTGAVLLVIEFARRMAEAVLGAPHADAKATV